MDAHVIDPNWKLTMAEWTKIDSIRQTLGEVTPTLDVLILLLKHSQLASDRLLAIKLMEYAGQV